MLRNYQETHTQPSWKARSGILQLFLEDAFQQLRSLRLKRMAVLPIQHAVQPPGGACTTAV